MKKVHYAILEDMKKYVKTFNPYEYESTGNVTDPVVIHYLQGYYNKHLPIDITAWIRVNEPDSNLIYAKGLEEQVCFVRDKLCPLLFTTYEECEKNPPMVISTHMSKSVLLPVYQITVPKHGLEIILRYNFYDWKVSIKSDKELNFDTMGLFDTTYTIPSIFCEGFPEDKVYGYYVADHSKFTFEIPDHYNLYAFFYLLRNCLGIKTKLY